MSINFEGWMESVDDIASDECGFTTEDLPDHLWRDLYEEEYSPEEAWQHYKEESDLFFE